ncbi:Ca2+-binding RTX toxin-like protein [Rhodovulum iodosum]|uniref:Ca2+-binding RTX toxin-like protein n=1 Tax=Rhodovulum iodosum TaxID=68291 RepID=A0ABV3XST0_9RHOB|nr:calcium-binding protein [Rhodovulum robiginosum]RSK30472.1 calcium-binding protein [Rhodovulum robiginosum]
MAVATISNEGGIDLVESAEATFALSLDLRDLEADTISFFYDISPGTATDADYGGGGGGGTLPIGPGTPLGQTVQFTIYSIGDDLVEPTETAFLDVTLTGITFGDGSTEKRIPINILDNARPEGALVVTGSANAGETLGLDTDAITDAEGLGTFSYQWYRDGETIAGADEDTYELTGDDIGAEITAEVSYVDGEGASESVTSAALGPVIHLNTDPVGRPALSGTAREDETLTADADDVSDVDGIPGPGLFQWLRDGVDIAGATGDTYTLEQADVGAEIAVAYRFTDGFGTDEEVISAATGAVENVNDAPTGAVALTGTAAVGETLGADMSAVEDEDGLGAFSHAWLRDGASIDGAAGDSYALREADLGTEISVRVSYTDGFGAAESLVSASSGPVLPVGLELIGTPGPDVLRGGAGNDTIRGLGGDDELYGEGGGDTIEGGDGLDTINGGDGDDTILGGASSADLRDVIYGGDGNDSIDAGYGNDLVFGMGGNDTIAGGFGADDLRGQAGNDVITGSALSDLVFGGDGEDFVNGGFGYDRINGGAGADRFYHLGIADHGSDWVQDYTAADGDVLLFGDATASADDFSVRFTHTSSPETGRSGDDDVQEAFVIYRPAGLIVWALVDGSGQDSLNIEIGGEVFDLLA